MNKKNYISVRDIAEDAKLNHEIAEELRRYKRRHPEHCEGSSQNKKALFHWILRQVLGSHISLRSARSEDDVPASKHSFDKFFPTLRMTCLLGTFTFIPTLAQAETCTPTPDCKSLGYTETSCPDDNGVKCPWNTSLMYCPQCKQNNVSQSCYVGMILNSDMTCSQNNMSGKTPIGVVFTTNKAVSLINLSSIASFRDTKTMCNNHKPSGISGWYLPNKDELLQIYNNINSVQIGLQNATGGSKLSSAYYWSSTNAGTYGMEQQYYVVNPVSGNTSERGDMYDTGYVRPVLAF